MAPGARPTFFGAGCTGAVRARRAKVRICSDCKSFGKLDRALLWRTAYFFWCWVHRSVRARRAKLRTRSVAGLCLSDFKNPYVRQFAAARLRDVNARPQCQQTEAAERRHKARAKPRIRGFAACAGHVRDVRDPVGPLRLNSNPARRCMEAQGLPKSSTNDAVAPHRLRQSEQRPCSSPCSFMCSA